MKRSVTKFGSLFSRLATSLVLFILVCGVVRACGSEYDVLRAQWNEMLTGGTSYDPADPDIARRISAMDTTTTDYWNRMDTSPDRTYPWSDLASTTISSHITSTYGRLKAMALAYSTYGSSYENDTNLRDDILGALDWMYENRYNENSTPYNNWWDWEIGTPLNLNDIVVLMYDELSTAQILHYMTAIERFTPSVTLTAANRVWKATIVALRGVIVQNAAKIAAARNGLSDVFRYVTSGDGFYRDGSFIQHGKHPYTGGYGISLLSNLANVMYLLSGSTWQVRDPNQVNVYRWVYDAFEPLIYRGAMMDMVRGREISRTGQDHASGHSAIQSIVRIAQFAPPEDTAAFRSMVKYWIGADVFRDFFANAPIPMIVLAKAIINDPDIEPAEEPVLHKRYPSMDRVVHLPPGFGFGLSLSSRRIFNYECINSENLKGWYTGSGMTYLYNGDLGQFNDNYWPTVNKYRLPGITVDIRSRGNCSEQSRIPSQTWVGGTDILEGYGISGMELADTGSTLAAKKSWFMFDDEIVALGSGITSMDNRTIETTIENRKLNAAGDNVLIVDGTVQPATLGWAETLRDISWAHLDGVGGYYFPGSAVIEALREARTSSWQDINAMSGSPTPITRNYLTLWFDHGRNPFDATYAYVLLPNKTPDEVRLYASNPDVTILENSADAQAVSKNSLSIVGVNFWSTGVKTVNGITSDTKASVMTRETARELELAVSDPTQANTGSINIEIDRSAVDVLSSDAAITVTQLSPTIQLAVDVNNARGATFRARLRLGK